MTDRVTPENAWAGKALTAHREQRGLTQRELAELAGIDRSRYNALENGRQRISPSYAERLAPHLGLTSPESLLPPPTRPVPVDDPLGRLAELEGEVATLRRELDDFVQATIERMARLEATPVTASQRSGRESAER